MNILSSKQDFNLLYIGPTDISEEIKKNIPKSWKLISVETLKEFLTTPVSVDIILDASIRDIIDLNLFEFSKVTTIGCASTGTNHIKRPVNAPRHIEIFSLRDTPDVLQKLTSAAEFSFALLLTLAKRVIPAANAVKSGFWNRIEFPGVVLDGKKLGLIGFGRIGRAMAVYANSFGMKVGFYDPYLTNKPIEILEYHSIEQLVENSDFISIHVPYNSEKDKKPIIDKHLFSLFKQGSYFINTSRGELIDEIGLITEIESGKILGAALDVLVDEPKIEENLIYRYAVKTGANIIFTPHIAGYSIENVRIAAIGMLVHIVKEVSHKTKL
jgi:D-3-phosphoglycerate dehydrogenase